MAETTTLVKTVVEVLNDGARGFGDIAEHIKNPDVKAFFVSESSTRAQFAQEVQSAAGITEEPGGTAAGSVHRLWADLKANLGGGDHTLLETAEQGEDAAKKAYKEALESDETPSAVRAVLLEQQPHIDASHDKVKALRDGLK